MLHVNRVWCVQEWTGTLEELAGKMTGTTWVLCTGIRWKTLLLLNDATSEVGAQEHAVLDAGTFEQIESLTVSRMKPLRLEGFLRELTAEGSEESLSTEGFDPDRQIQTLKEHGRCPLLLREGHKKQMPKAAKQPALGQFRAIP